MFKQITLWHLIAIAAVVTLWRLASAINRLVNTIEEEIDSRVEHVEELVPSSMASQPRHPPVNHHKAA